MAAQSAAMTTQDRPRSSGAIPRLLLVVCCMLAASGLRAQSSPPDLSGTYNVATVTPLQRPEAFGNNLLLSAEQAEKIVARVAAAKAASLEASDPDREAPPAGGDGSRGAAGNVGGYNSFWIDNGDTTFSIDGKFRTSIITSPENGRYPALTPAGQQRAAARRAMYRENSGEAWWLEIDGPGPYDGPETRSLSDRCLLGFGSTGGPPMLPVLYNNLKRIVQTPDYVLILVEMVHDARIIRLNSEHAPADARFWLGDSIGWWEGDTLVVETTNFRDQPALGLATSELKVTERLRRIDDQTLLYSFIVEDPNTWTEPWGGEYPWPATEERVYEYACHEGNYAMQGILKGARMLESEHPLGEAQD
jgi:hypothetical protein